MSTPDTTTLAGTAIERLAPYLPAAAEPDRPSGPASVATRDLYLAVARGLDELGEQAALAEFVRRPDNDSLVRRLLADAVAADPGYAGTLAAAVAATPAAPATPVAPTAPSAPATGFPEPPAGPLGPTSSGRRLGLLLGLPALVLALALVAFLLARDILADLSGGAGLTSTSTCADFLDAPRADQARAVEEISLARGIRGGDEEVALIAVNYTCRARPEQPLGEAVARLRG